MRDGQGNPIRSAEGDCIDVSSGREGGPTEGCAKSEKRTTYRILQNLIPLPWASHEDPPALIPTESVRFVPSTVFAAGQAGIGLELQDELSGFLASLEGYQRIERFEVTGYSDGNANLGYGEWLGAKRAESVRNFLIARGIAAGMISSHGMAQADDAGRQRFAIVVTVRGRR